MTYPGGQSGSWVRNGAGSSGQPKRPVAGLLASVVSLLPRWIRCLTFCALAAPATCTPLFAQNAPSAPRTNGGVVGTMGGGAGSSLCGGAVIAYSTVCDPGGGLSGADQAIFGGMASMPGSDILGITSTESCNTWTEAGVHSPTVSATRLEVPSKASSEYQKACGAFKDKRFSAAEDAVRKAIGLDPNYAAAWVVLGQVLDAQKKTDDARKACSQAMTVDPTYVPPYICLADFAAKDDNWDEVSRLSTRAMELDPVSDVYAFYFTAAAEYHLHQIVKAETDALSAVRLDIWHHLPQVHRLLAKIYEIKGDSRAEMAQLKEYLKQAPNSGDSAAMKSLLAQLEAEPSQPAK
jgi:Tetratricopeptide repeat